MRTLKILVPLSTLGLIASACAADPVLLPSPTRAEVQSYFKGTEAPAGAAQRSASQPLTDDELFMGAFEVLHQISKKDPEAEQRAVAALSALPDLQMRLDAIIQLNPTESYETYVSRKRLFQALVHVKQRRVVEYLISLVDQSTMPNITLPKDVAGPEPIGMLAAQTLFEMQLPDGISEFGYRPPVEKLVAAKSAWLSWFQSHQGQLPE
jgi:hypothetical protein